METTTKLISSCLNENYAFEDEKVMGNTTVVTKENKVVELNGTVYEKKADGTQGKFIGNFNGRVSDDGTFMYTTSQMTRQQYNTVMQLTEELENQLINK